MSAAIPVFVLPVLAFVPGMAFALLVMIPWAKACGLNLGAAAACGLLSVVGYYAAFRVAEGGDFLLTPAGGALATALALVPALVAKQETRRVSCRAILVGACAALIFPLAISTKTLFLLFLGNAAWQVAVGSVLTQAVHK